jgi:hypothetical protein
MKKSRHHYVPKLYLRNFASAHRRINILNLKKGEFHQDGSLKDQCFRPKFYGKDDDVENHLMNIEGLVAPTLSSIIKGSVLPKPSSDEHKHLLIFVALQILRTGVAADSVAEGLNKVIDNVAPRDKDMTANKEAYLTESNEAVLLLLQNYPLIAMCLDDLGMLLLINKTAEGFVTSDNPIVQYNQYLEGLKMGTTGALRRGLQLFLPLSPKHLILFYDTHIYKLLSKNKPSLDVSNPNDVFTLNLLQAINADKVVLFSRWEEVGKLRQVLNKSVRFRRNELARVEEYFAEDDPQHHSLLQMYSVPLNIKLSLSFMRLRRRVQGIPRNERAIEYRKPIGPENTSSAGNKAVRKFVRRDLLPDSE